MKIYLPEGGHDHRDDDANHEAEPHNNELGAQGWLNLAADSLHNFTDGIALGVAYKAGKSLGFATLLSVFFHEIPHELADFAILVANGLRLTNTNRHHTFLRNNDLILCL